MWRQRVKEGVPQLTLDSEVWLIHLREIQGLTFTKNCCPHKSVRLGTCREEDWALCLFWGSWPRRAWAAEPDVLGGSYVILGHISELLYLL